MSGTPNIDRLRDLLDRCANEDIHTLVQELAPFPEDHIQPYPYMFGLVSVFARQALWEFDRKVQV